MKIGILGGRFDPPHVGHIKAARKALEEYKLDEVWFVPYNVRNLEKVKDKRQKAKVTYAKQRLEMARLAIAGEKRFRVLDIEIKRGGVSYTIDTVLELKKKFPEHSFYWIIGEDLVSELPRWKDYKRLIKEIEFIVVKNIVDKKERKISSSEIRKRVKRGLSIEGMVTKKAEEYIRRKKLYK